VGEGFAGSDARRLGFVSEDVGRRGLLGAVVGLGFEDVGDVGGGFACLDVGGDKSGVEVEDPDVGGDAIGAVLIGVGGEDASGDVGGGFECLDVRGDKSVGFEDTEGGADGSGVVVVRFGGADVGRNVLIRFGGTDVERWIVGISLGGRFVGFVVGEGLLCTEAG